MGKSKIKNPAQRSGMLGQNVAVRQVGTRTIVKSRPPYKQVATPPQLAVRQKFQSAADWVKWKLAQPGQADAYKLRITPNLTSAYSVAMRDYLNPPTVASVEAKRYLGKAGDAITVIAFDDFAVARVEVELHDAGGVLIERGDAVQSAEHNQQWIYRATVANPAVTGTVITATAFDNPGHEGSLKTVML